MTAIAEAAPPARLRHDDRPLFGPSLRDAMATPFQRDLRAKDTRAKVRDLVDQMRTWPAEMLGYKDDVEGVPHKAVYRPRDKVFTEWRDSDDRLENGASREAAEFTVYSEELFGTPYGLFADDPVGFVRWVLAESTWSKQEQVLMALTRNRRVAVPSAFGTGKTHIAARAVLWRACVFPPGTSLTVTTATRFRQVQRQLWPHIARCVERAGLVGIHADQTQLKMQVPGSKRWEDVAYGFSAPPTDESAVQGIHAPRLFIVIDEAGGIGAIIGEALRGLMTGDDTRQLAIGNPPTDNEGSWFERHTKNPTVETIQISAYDAPLQTGEEVWCQTCPPQVPKHQLGVHLVDRQWIDEAVADHGEDSAFVQAKVYARFPHGGPSRTIPSMWIDNAVDAPEPTGDPDYVRLCDLGILEETAEWLVQRGGWVRLGVDVAAGGGDELAISRWVGDMAQTRHVSSGPDNADSMKVAAKILAEIKAAERLRAALGTAARVRVKIDSIGVGWAVYGLLRAWGQEGVHAAEIVPVNVAEDTGRAEPTTLQPYRKRDEMWLAGRHVLSPRPGGPAVRLRIDAQTATQLGAPNMSVNSQGKTVIESKDSMKKRGIGSPDRAEGLLLGCYEPKAKRTRKARVVVA